MFGPEEVVSEKSVSETYEIATQTQCGCQALYLLVQLRRMKHHGRITNASSPRPMLLDGDVTADDALTRLYGYATAQGNDTPL